jgi:FkbM family methyltransferase
MNFTHLTVIRNIARNLGITRLLSLRSRIANKKLTKYYATHSPKLAEINMLGYTYKLNTLSAYEWLRANAVYQDKHIIEALLKYLEPGMDCWDIGASIGAYSCILSLKNRPDGVVYAFEPELASRQKLKNNVALNNVKNVVIYDVALGKEENELQLVLAHDATAGTHKLEENAIQNPDNSQLVKVTTGDILLAKDKLKVPGVLKIDVEGWEEQVLLGARHTIANESCRAIMIEMHFSIFAAEKDNERAGRISKILFEAGFQKQVWVDPSHLLATK